MDPLWAHVLQGSEWTPMWLWNLSCPRRKRLGVILMRVPLSWVCLRIGNEGQTLCSCHSWHACTTPLSHRRTWSRTKVDAMWWSGRRPIPKVKGGRKDCRTCTGVVAIIRCRQGASVMNTASSKWHHAKLVMFASFQSTSLRSQWEMVCSLPGQASRMIGVRVCQAWSYLRDVCT